MLKQTSEPEFGFELVRVLQQHFRFDPRSNLQSSTITALAVSNARLFAGDALGRIGLWSLPGTDFHLDEGLASACMLCSTRFGLLEKRIQYVSLWCAPVRKKADDDPLLILSCASCSAIICWRDTCSSTMPDLPGKYCTECSGMLSSI